MTMLLTLLRARRTHALLPLIAGALLLAGSGCTNPFTPATPEPPSGAGVPEEFGTIDLLLQTMETAIQARSTSGANAYIAAFAESTTASQRAFRAFHDPAVKAAWLAGSGGQAAPEPWTLALERGLYSELSRIRPNDPYIFLFTPDAQSPGDEDLGNNVTSIHRKYQLFATPNGVDPVVIASGYADLLLLYDGHNYSILEWHDRLDPDFGVNPPDSQRSFTYYRLESQ
jgi:hypothetical protein